MGKPKRTTPMIRGQNKQQQNTPKEVDSLFDLMKDGCEFQSIVSLVPRNGDLVPDLKRAVSEIETVRGHPCICYVANVVNPEVNGIAIDFSDDLPFNELVTSAQVSEEVDVFIATPGGIGSQIPHFVTALRAKYKKVNFIIPYMCMSAGTLFVLSGDNIYMDARGFIGPIDPQVPLKTGEYVPAQSVLHLLDKIKEEGDLSLLKGENIPWHLVRLLDTMDHRQIGEAYTSSEYSIKIAKEFLLKYKFKNWIIHSSTSDLVTDAERETAAVEISKLLCSNDHWKSHSHGISREVANSEVKLHIECTESIPGFERAVRRSWAVFSYVLERTTIRKVFISSNFTLLRFIPIKGGTHE